MAKFQRLYPTLDKLRGAGFSVRYVEGEGYWISGQDESGKNPEDYIDSIQDRNFFVSDRVEEWIFLKPKKGSV